jgi:hypothetical protein
VGIQLNRKVAADCQHMWFWHDDGMFVCWTQHAYMVSPGLWYVMM